MEKTYKTRIGVMGGTFDPIHYGHLMIAENAREQFQLQKILFLPAGRPPHKHHITEAVHRCRMVSLAISGNPWFALDQTEVESDGVSYTYLTMQKLKQRYGDVELFFILGADSLFDFESWMKPEAILQNCNILAAYRDNTGSFFGQLEYLDQKYPGKFFPLDTPSLEVSSQDIRMRVQYGRTIRYLVPEEVEAYIRNHKFYQKAPERKDGT
ncbi:nicotinate-nucleotide adenylyltransferase [Lachnospiraceae bacterium 29-84]